MLEAAFEVGSLVATRRFLRPTPGPDGGVAKGVMDKGTVGIVIGIQHDLITVDFGGMWAVKVVEARHLDVLGQVGTPAGEPTVEDDLVAIAATLRAENAALRMQLTLASSSYRAGGAA